MIDLRFGNKIEFLHGKIQPETAKKNLPVAQQSAKIEDLAKCLSKSAEVTLLQ